MIFVTLQTLHSFLNDKSPDFSSKATNSCGYSRSPDYYFSFLQNLPLVSSSGQNFHIILKIAWCQLDYLALNMAHDILCFKNSNPAGWHFGLVCLDNEWIACHEMWNTHNISFHVALSSGQITRPNTCIYDRIPTILLAFSPASAVNLGHC